MGAALAIAALILTPAVALDPPTAPLSGEAIASLVVLGLLCTAAAFVIYGMLIAEVGAGRALVVTYIDPVSPSLWASRCSGSGRAPGRSPAWC